MREMRYKLAKIDTERRAQRTARLKAIKALIAVQEAFHHDEQINSRWLSAQVRDFRKQIEAHLKKIAQA